MDRSMGDRLSSGILRDKITKNKLVQKPNYDLQNCTSLNYGCKSFEIGSLYRQIIKKSK